MKALQKIIGLQKFTLFWTNRLIWVDKKPKTEQSPNSELWKELQGKISSLDENFFEKNLELLISTDSSNNFLPDLPKNLKDAIINQWNYILNDDSDLGKSKGFSEVDAVEKLNTLLMSDKKEEEKRSSVDDIQTETGDAAKNTVEKNYLSKPLDMWTNEDLTDAVKDVVMLIATKDNSDVTVKLNTPALLERKQGDKGPFFEWNNMIITSFKNTVEKYGLKLADGNAPSQPEQKEQKSYKVTDKRGKTYEFKKGETIFINNIEYKFKELNKDGQMVLDGAGIDRDPLNNVVTKTPEEYATYKKEKQQEALEQIVSFEWTVNDKREKTYKFKKGETIFINCISYIFEGLDKDGQMVLDDGGSVRNPKTNVITKSEKEYHEFRLNEVERTTCTLPDVDGNDIEIKAGDSLKFSGDNDVYKFDGVMKGSGFLLLNDGQDILKPDSVTLEKVTRNESKAPSPELEDLPKVINDENQEEDWLDVPIDEEDGIDFEDAKMIQEEMDLLIKGQNKKPSKKKPEEPKSSAQVEFEKRAQEFEIIDTAELEKWDGENLEKAREAETIFVTEKGEQVRMRKNWHREDSFSFYFATEDFLFGGLAEEGDQTGFYNFVKNQEVTAFVKGLDNEKRAKRHELLYLWEFPKQLTSDDLEILKDEEIVLTSNDKEFIQKNGQTFRIKEIERDDNTGNLEKVVFETLGKEKKEFEYKDFNDLHRALKFSDVVAKETRHLNWAELKSLSDEEFENIQKQRNIYAKQPLKDWDYPDIEFAKDRQVVFNVINLDSRERYGDQLQIKEFNYDKDGKINHVVLSWKEKKTIAPSLFKQLFNDENLKVDMDSLPTDYDLPCSDFLEESFVNELILNRGRMSVSWSWAPKPDDPSGGTPWTSPWTPPDDLDDLSQLIRLDEKPLQEWTPKDIQDAKEADTVFVITAEWEFKWAKLRIVELNEDEFKMQGAMHTIIKYDKFEEFYTFVKDLGLEIDKGEDDDEPVDPVPIPEIISPAVVEKVELKAMQAVSEIEQKMNEINEKIKKVVDIQGSYENNQEAYEKNKEHLKDLMASIPNELDGIDKALEELPDDVAKKENLQAKSSSLRERFNNIEENKIPLEIVKQASSTKNRLEIEPKVNEIAVALKSVEEGVEILDQGADAFNQFINSYVEKMWDNAEFLLKGDKILKEEIGTRERNIRYLKLMSGMWREIILNGKSVEDVEETIQTLEKEVEDLGSLLTLNESKIRSLKSELQQVEEDLTEKPEEPEKISVPKQAFNWLAKRAGKISQKLLWLKGKNKADKEETQTLELTGTTATLGEENSMPPAPQKKKTKKWIFSGFKRKKKKT